MILRRVPDLIGDAVQLADGRRQVERLQSERHGLRPLLNVRLHQHQARLHTDLNLRHRAQLLEGDLVVVLADRLRVPQLFLQLLEPLVHGKVDNIVWTVLQDAASNGRQVKVTTRRYYRLFVEPSMFRVEEACIQQLLPHLIGRG